MSSRASLAKVSRVVVKLGTSVCLIPGGRPNGDVLLPLAREIAALRERGIEVVLVSSGAVGMGRLLDRHDRVGSQALAGKQALAALGQTALMRVYQSLFELLGIDVAQVLLTRMDLGSRQRYLNARNTLLTLLKAEILPIINENDSVATEEIRFGDNDILASLVGSVVDADLVVNLTQTDGLLRPHGDGYKLVNEVDQIDDEVYSWVVDKKTQWGTGGMASKLHAAKAATDYGGNMVIARAAEPNILTRLIDGEPLGTLFSPGHDRVNLRKRWLASSALCRGSVRVDDGATRALVRKNSSLLAVGITTVIGEFSVGDIVAVLDAEGRELGRGLINYDSRDVDKIKGLNTEDIAGILESPGHIEVIHRDNLFIRKES